MAAAAMALLRRRCHRLGQPRTLPRWQQAAQTAAAAAAAGGAGDGAIGTRDDDWGDSDSEAPAHSDDEAAPKAPSTGVEAGAHADQYGALPTGWTVQVDDEGDVWYYNELTQQTSCAYR